LPNAGDGIIIAVADKRQHSQEQLKIMELEWQYVTSSLQRSNTTQAYLAPTIGKKAGISTVQPAHGTKKLRITDFERWPQYIG